MDEELSSYLTAESLVGTWIMTVAPELALRRVIETVTLEEASVRRDVSLELTLPTKDPLLVPILRPGRGVLVDNFRLHGESDTHAFTLNREETVTTTIQLIRKIVQSTLDNLKVKKLGFELTSSMAERVAKRFCRFPVQTPSSSLQVLHIMSVLQRVDENQMARIDGNTDYLACLKALGADSEFVNLMSLFRTNRLFLVPFTASQGSRIAFSYEAVLPEVIKPGAYRGLRTALGHAPYDFRFEIPLAIRTQSYHFRFRGPTGQYIYRQEVLVPRFLVTTSQDPQDWELMRLSRKRSLGFVEGDHAASTNYSHLYIGNLHLGSPVPRRLFARVRICERPLGEMGKTFFGVSVCFGVLLAIAFFGSALVHDGSGSGDVIAVLAILPGLAAYASSTRDAGDPVMVSPLLARIGPTIATYCSLAAAILILAWATSGTSASAIWHMPKGVFAGYLCILAILTWLILWTAFRTIVSLYRFRITKHAEKTASLVED